MSPAVALHDYIDIGWIVAFNESVTELGYRDLVTEIVLDFREGLVHPDYLVDNEVDSRWIVHRVNQFDSGGN